jgi:NADH dehydrogenase (ubiquinone) 1 alpha subcomplex subunit 13
MFVLCKSPSSYRPDSRTVPSTHLGYPNYITNCGVSGPDDGHGQTAVISWPTVPAYTRELDRESAWTRIHLTPLLVAEADRDLYRRTKASIAREAAIMEHVQGWKVRKLNE